MKAASGIFIALFVITVVSCSHWDRKGFEARAMEIGIGFGDHYKVDSIILLNTTDSALEAHIRVSDADKARILNKIKSGMEFPVVSTREEYFSDYSNSTDTIRGFIVGSTYYYRVYRDRFIKVNGQDALAGYKTYLLELDTTTNQVYFKFDQQ